eukprot:gnl/Dysnectes_brevis/1392_a1568_3740.p1 GENE.gnl/Dysnectes_brevis/1392_a1568_3740~~gnl/Dysnectes_brevis/1392_a1568_3740.p1  ORF type:complete len:394 (-),score=165.79 gnl/Dysnectes_brevis/1392_a1568_3740:45-1226(-)
MYTVYNPVKLHLGVGANAKIGGEIAAKGLKKVLLVMGGGSIRRNGVLDTVVKSLGDNGIEHVIVEGVRANPEFLKVVEACHVAKKEKCDAVLAVGGGSVIDSCKAVIVGATLENPEDVWNCYEGTLQVTASLPLFTVLTISATASEMNCGSVLQRDDLKKKFAFHNPLGFPVCSCVDPAAQTSLPWYQTVNGLVDTITHTCEYLMCCTKPEEHETGFNIGVALVKSVIACGDRLQKDPTDIPARTNFCWAATAALNGITSVMTSASGDWAVHMLEHAMGGVDPRISHGAGLGVAMPAYIEHHALKGERHEVWARMAKDIFGGETWEDLVAGLKATWIRWGHPTKLDTLFGGDMSDEQFKTLVDTFMMRPYSGYRETCSIPRDEAEAIYNLMRK